MFHPQENLRLSALALIEGEKSLVANLANLSALFFHTLPDLNWAGFYLWDFSDQELVLGPFQGKPACIRIRPGQGVCGTALVTRSVQRVDDVHLFPGHIACDSASRSELVIPLLKGELCLGVLDLDSPKLARFNEAESQQVSALMSELVPKLWINV